MGSTCLIFIEFHNFTTKMLIEVACIFFVSDCLLEALGIVLCRLGVNFGQLGANLSQLEPNFSQLEPACRRLRASFALTWAIHGEL